ncbi:MAG: hypothetical protein LBN06_07890 [Prevotellaceae bacterium]|jgi:hypothetical protein|nr:hypothetical protein [Prevotellaceae bacterium]
MKMQVQIFVEGKADLKFITDYMMYLQPSLTLNSIKSKWQLIGTNLVISLQEINGWTQINSVQSRIKEMELEEGITLIIFDADTADNKGGFFKRKQEIDSLLSGLSYQLFLFPNNCDDGTLEDLLENIVCDDNLPIFNCWSSFETCLKEKASSKIGKELTIPAKKSKIYLYLETLSGKTKEERNKIKDPYRDYRNSALWNLNHEYLASLKNFLTTTLV